MLILSRKPEERVLIGKNVTISVVSVQGNRVRLGIDAPSDVRVLRGELESSAVAPNADRESPPGGSPSGSDARPPRVLVIDDSDSDRAIIRRLLGGTECELLEATSGSEALTVLDRHAPDLVLLDYRLPDCNGLDLLGRIRGITPAPVVMLTGQGSQAVAVSAMKAGASDYLVKGEASAHSIRECVASALPSNRAARQLAG